MPTSGVVIQAFANVYIEWRLTATALYSEHTKPRKGFPVGDSKHGVTIPLSRPSRLVRLPYCLLEYLL